ncbi:response regulator [Amantichitinum ursilacus]|uniref:Sporulation initiation phosphotransferase F n=1 Tax=Amantichitinum ursilacus TaxID=857265 RepID=A0A0N0XIZ2_9NEIS|nr:response regulator [Amantichitinum ursilacus]KPC53201.1 Sporulation initiation phosphotransferase F [Amantichitinum ursilacus]
MTTILVVDDEFLIADILGMALEDEGYMVVFASNGKRALEVLARERAGLVITDFMMPVMNGMELAQNIKSRPETAHLPIILMSGAQAHIANQHPELFASVFDKPFDIDMLLERVAQLIGHPSSD